jgi:hypothetical protein
MSDNVWKKYQRTLSKKSNRGSLSSVTNDWKNATLYSRSINPNLHDGTVESNISKSKENAIKYTNKAENILVSTPGKISNVIKFFEAAFSGGKEKKRRAEANKNYNIRLKNMMDDSARNAIQQYVRDNSQPQSNTKADEIDKAFKEAISGEGGGPNSSFNQIKRKIESEIKELQKEMDKNQTTNKQQPQEKQPK